MKSLFVAVLFAGSVAVLGVANAADGCGPGCHGTVEGACVIDNWGAPAPVVNECPVTTRAQPPCPFGYAWSRRFKACFER